MTFTVPPRLRDYAPEGAAALSICPRCLDLSAADPSVAAEAPDFSRIVDAFPDGEAGMAMAIAVGLLVDSLAMHRDAVAELFDVVGDTGADPWLVIERLAVTPTVEPDADLARLRRQLDQLLG